MLRLPEIREQIEHWAEGLLDRDGLYGSYRMGKGKRPDLYSSLDMALTRTVMGEDLLTSLSERQKREWTEHINSFARSNYHSWPGDGSYEDTYGHYALHANGMVIGALGVLGGQQRWPCQLYAPFNTPEKVSVWLEGIDWAGQWRASHLFWGGMHCFSFSRMCTPEWIDTVIGWLDANLDRDTGWWRRGVAHSDRHQPLGGSVHIVPIYTHHGRTFPAPERLIDSTLALQLPSGRWLETPDPNPTHYLELDALYALKVARDLVPAYRRDDIERSLDRYIDVVDAYWATQRDTLFALHPHRILSVAGIVGLFQQHRPDQFRDSRTWSDIFSDRSLYRTDRVEVLG